MRNLVIIFIGFFTLFSMSSTAQVIGHEIGVGLVDLYNPDNTNQQNSMFGARYKLHIKKMAVRVGVDFFYDENENKYSVNTNTLDQKLKEIKLSLGTERSALNTEKLQLYYGLDLFYFISESRSKNYYGLTFSETKIDKEAIGFSPLMGMRFFMYKNISLGTEIKVVYEGYENVTVNKYNQVKNETKTTGSTFYMSPLGIISLNIHF